MTTPYERTQSVLQTRRLLSELADGKKDVDGAWVRQRAEMLLRHFPVANDVALSAKVLPLIWADPSAKWYE